MRGKENGGAGATQEDRSGASAPLSGASKRERAKAWWSGSERKSGGPGCTSAAAAGRTVGHLKVLEGEVWLEHS